MIRPARVRPSDQVFDQTTSRCLSLAPIRRSGPTVLVRRSGGTSYAPQAFALASRVAESHAQSGHRLSHKSACRCQMRSQRYQQCNVEHRSHASGSGQARGLRRRRSFMVAAKWLGAAWKQNRDSEVPLCRSTEAILNGIAEHPRAAGGSRNGHGTRRDNVRQDRCS